MDAADLYARHRAEVARYFLYRLGDRELAQDLAHDVFVRAIPALERFRDDGRGAGPWLMTIARNRLADHLRSARTRFESPWTEPPAEARTVWGETPDDPSDVAERGETAAVLRCLPQRQAHVLAMRFLADRSVEETADALGVGAGAVRQLQYRAARSARRLLEGARV